MLTDLTEINSDIDDKKIVFHPNHRQYFNVISLHLILRIKAFFCKLKSTWCPDFSQTASILFGWCIWLQSRNMYNIRWQNWIAVKWDSVTSAVLVIMIWLQSNSIWNVCMCFYLFWYIRQILWLCMKCNHILSVKVFRDFWEKAINSGRFFFMTSKYNLHMLSPFFYSYFVFDGTSVNLLRAHRTLDLWELF